MAAAAATGRAGSSFSFLFFFVVVFINKHFLRIFFFFFFRVAYLRTLPTPPRLNAHPNVVAREPCAARLTLAFTANSPKRITPSTKKCTA